jgi:hypothetical protein
MTCASSQAAGTQRIQANYRNVLQRPDMLCFFPSVAKGRPNKPSPMFTGASSDHGSGNCCPGLTSEASRIRHSQIDGTAILHGRVEAYISPAGQLIEGGTRPAVGRLEISAVDSDQPAGGFKNSVRLL